MLWREWSGIKTIPPLPLVSSSDPALKEGKGLVYIERFLGLDDVSIRNSVTPIRFMPCSLHVIIM